MRDSGLPLAYASEPHFVAMLAVGSGMESPNRRLSTSMAAAVISSVLSLSDSCTTNAETSDATDSVQCHSQT